jgi:hypothetical protein
MPQMSGPNLQENPIIETFKGCVWKTIRWQNLSSLKSWGSSPEITFPSAGDAGCVVQVLVHMPGPKRWMDIGLSRLPRRRRRRRQWRLDRGTGADTESAFFEATLLGLPAREWIRHERHPTDERLMGTRAEICGRVSSVAIPKGAKPGEMIAIRVLKGTDKGAKVAVAVMVPKNRRDSLRPADGLCKPKCLVGRKSASRIRRSALLKTANSTRFIGYSRNLAIRQDPRQRRW